MDLQRIVGDVGGLEMDNIEVSSSLGDILRVLINKNSPVVGKVESSG